MLSSNRFFHYGVFSSTDFKSPKPPFNSGTNDLILTNSKSLFCYSHVCYMNIHQTRFSVLLVVLFLPNSGLPPQHPKNYIHRSTAPRESENKRYSLHHTPSKQEVGSRDGHNFQTLSSPRPEEKRFTLNSRKAVAIALTEQITGISYHEASGPPSHHSDLPELRSLPLIAILACRASPEGA